MRKGIKIKILINKTLNANRVQNDAQQKTISL